MKCALPCPFDRAGTPCQLELFHEGNCSWPTEIDMASFLAGDTGFPALPPRIAELNAAMHWPERRPEARAAKKDTRPWVPPPPEPRGPLPPVPDRPWCPSHGWDRDWFCILCTRVHRQHARKERDE